MWSAPTEVACLSPIRLVTNPLMRGTADAWLALDWGAGENPLSRFRVRSSVSHFLCCFSAVREVNSSRAATPYLTG